jgi:hypothetical protein
MSVCAQLSAAIFCVVMKLGWGSWPNANRHALTGGLSCSTGTDGGQTHHDGGDRLSPP